MFGLLIEYLALTGTNTITLRVNAEPGWKSSFEKGQDNARRKLLRLLLLVREHYKDFSATNCSHTIMNLAEFKKNALACQFWQ